MVADMFQKIAIYEGEGSSLLGLKGLNRALYLSETSLFHTDWDKKCSIFVMPGGRDRPYAAVLHGKGTQKLRSFVENGGTYIGICAGAYFACSEIEFDRGTPLEICEPRELQFFSGKAVGPVYGTGIFSYENEQGAKAALIETEETSFYSYFNGGCTFVGTPHKILARYADLPHRPPAIIECKVGKGKAILSGVHFEISAGLLSEEDRYHKPMIPLIRSTEEKRRAFFSTHLT